MAFHGLVLASFALLLAIDPFTLSYTPALFHGHSSFSLLAATKTPTEALKKTLLNKIDMFRAAQALDGDVPIDFGVAGGEINATSRSPQKIDFYATSDAVGHAADDVLTLCDELSTCNPTKNATQFLGDWAQGQKSPLHGTWNLLFTTAADATFSKNSTRGDAVAQNTVDGRTSKITNTISFLGGNRRQRPPLLKQLNVVIRATALSEKRVGLKFRYAKVVFSRFFFLPVRWCLYIPIPATLIITRILVAFQRAFKRTGQSTKPPPEPYFDILYLDEQLRIQRTGEDNVFVQARPSWEAAQGLFRKS
jgi:hypothetical protein